jgi:hypothetical protein
MTQMYNLEKETINDSLEYLQEQYPNEVFEGRVVRYEDTEKGIKAEFDPEPTACAVCAGKPVVSYRTGIIISGGAYGFCKLHKNAFAIASKDIKGKTYHWFRF